MKRGFLLIEVLLSLVVMLAFSLPLINQIVLLKKIVLSSNQNYIAVVNAKNILECIVAFGEYSSLNQINDFDELKSKIGFVTSEDKFIYNITITNEDFTHTISNESTLLQTDNIHIDNMYINNYSPIEPTYDFEIHESNGVESYLHNNAPLKTNNEYISFEGKTFKFLIQKDKDNNPVNIFKGDKFVLKINSNDISNLEFDFNNLEYNTIIVLLESETYQKPSITQNSMSLVMTRQLPKKIYYSNYYITVSVYNQDKEFIKTLSRTIWLKKEETP